ncbi:Stp1/IreP family PP2C-type Ser/Thr phosphatase [Comamonas faecalis]
MKSLPCLVLHCAGVSDTGRVRNNNEDAMAWHAGTGLAVLADGMGGYNAGEVAAALAVDGIGSDMLRWLRQHPGSSAEQVQQALAAAVRAANQAIVRHAGSDAQCAGMGTTLVAAVFGAGTLVLCHVGDSRCYRLRAGSLQQLTRDHSWLQEQIDAGWLSAEEAQYYGPRNLVTRALGVQDNAQEECQNLPVQAGDLYLLCSDGLHDLIGDALLQAALARSQTLEDKAQSLVDLANAHGGNDNISVLLVQVGAAGDCADNGLLQAPLQRLP